MKEVDQKARTTLIDGVLAIAIALGISRFGYTPLLPAMQKAFGFDDGFAGYLASANYAGYLLGSIWAALTTRYCDRTIRIRLNLFITMVCTVGMGLVSHQVYWLAFRFVAGFTSAMVFILVSTHILEELARLNRQAWVGWLYAGVGFGIAISAAAAPVLTAQFGWRAGWIGMGAICFVMFLGTDNRSITGHRRYKMQINITEVENQSVAHLLPWLAVAYGLVGLGYIVTGTFLVSFVQRAFDSMTTGAIAWFFVGLAAIPSCPAWTALGRKYGTANALIATQTVQAVGIIAPILIPGYFGAFLGAICFGGTFVAIAALTVILGRQIDPPNAHRNIAILTAAFGFGQMAGPTIAGKAAVLTNGFSVPLLCAATTIVMATLILLTGLALSNRKNTMQVGN